MKRQVRSITDLFQV